MSSDSECSPSLKSAGYSRGPTDKTPDMFPFERKLVDAITERMGKASDKTQDKPKIGKTFSGSGH